MNYDVIKLDKGIYNDAMARGKTLSQHLEDIDPSENYKDSPLKGLDGFQRQLKRFDIKVKGAGSDTVEKFFSTHDSSVLFPEFVSRSVREGLEEMSIIPEIIATTTKIDSDSYKSIYMEDDAAEQSLSRVAEGAIIPETRIKTREHIVPVYKYGRILKMSYEAMRRKKIDLVSVFLRKLGNRIALNQVKEAVSVLINGDGNSNGAPVFNVGTTPIGGAAGTLGYSELLDFWAEFNPYEMNTVIAPRGMLLELLKLSEFKDPQAGFDFQRTGKLVNPLGATLLRSDDVEANAVIGLDKRYALEMVVEQGVTTETDKLIDHQFERIAITQVAGFAKIDNQAAKLLKK